MGKMEGAKSSVQLSITSEDKQSEVEIIEVRDEHRWGVRTHYLLVEILTRSVRVVGCELEHCDASITARATYLGGSEGSAMAGTLICDMGGKMSSYQRAVKLTNGGVMVASSMRGLHIGTYLFHRIISWAKQFDATYKIVQFPLIAGDADSENKDRRNKLYLNSGIRFIWSGEPGVAGTTDPDLMVGDLIPYAHFPNIQKDHRFSALDRTWRELATLRERVRGLRASKRYYRREYETIRSRLRAIAGFVNYPAYILCLILGLIIGRALGWYQGF